MLNTLLGRKKKTLDEQAREWKLHLNAEQRKIDRQIRKIKAEEAKVVKQAKLAAKKNEVDVVRIMAKEILHSRGAVKRLFKAKTQINSVNMQIQQQVSQVKLAGNIQKSGEVMKHMNSLCRVSEVADAMRTLSAEMTKAGVMEEMMNDTLDNALDDDVSESETEEEVSKLVDAVMQNKLEGTKVRATEMPQQQAHAEADAVEEEEQEEDDEMDDALQARLKALRE